MQSKEMGQLDQQRLACPLGFLAEGLDVGRRSRNEMNSCGIDIGRISS